MRLAHQTFYCISSPSDIATFFKAAWTETSLATTTMVMRHVAGAPASALDRVYAADDSGIAARPLPGSRVPPAKRFYHLHHRLVVAQMSGRRLGDTATRFAGAFERLLRGVAGDAWTPVPDLHAWLGSIVFTASVEALCGTRIFAVNPTLARDFRAFYAAVPTLLKGLPRVLAPGAHAARERMLESLKRWNRAAREEAPLEAAGPGWDEWWGCEFVKERKRLYGRMAGGVDEDGMAADDLILLFV